MKIKDAFKLKVEPKLWEVLLVVFLMSIGPLLLNWYLKKIDSKHIIISYIFTSFFIIILRIIRTIINNKKNRDVEK